MVGNVPLSLVSRHFYQRGKLSLYGNNTIIFDNFGYDLGEMCRVWNNCGGCPLVNEVVLEVGDAYCMEVGEVRARAFSAVLQRLNTPLRVRHLYIRLELYHFKDSTEFIPFILSLVNVRVHHRFGLIALPVHLNFVIENLTGALHMDIDPIESFVQPSTPGRIGAYHGIFAPKKVGPESE